ncbi:hypothetical protein DL768_001126 [Monosporascus sp. mg162]|nr:hypothetical protein DL768_001126 [Monosporascus sp. mg162]
MAPSTVPSMLSALMRPGLTQAIYAGNALWFTSAFFNFSFDQKAVMRSISRRATSADAKVRQSPEGDPWHHDIMAYMGHLSTSLAVLAGLRLYALRRPSRLLGDGGRDDIALDVTALAVLCVANFSQVVLNFTLSRNNDRWIMGKGLDHITILDLLFAVIDGAAAIARVIA